MSVERISTRCTHEIAEPHSCSWNQLMGDEDELCDCCRLCETECDLEI